MGGISGCGSDGWATNMGDTKSQYDRRMSIHKLLQYCYEQLQMKLSVADEEQ